MPHRGMAPSVTAGSALRQSNRCTQRWLPRWGRISGVAAVQQRQIHPHAAAGLRHLDDVRAQEGPAGGGVGHRLGLADVQLLPASGTSTSCA